MFLETTSRNFEALAQVVTNEFMTSGTPLDDGISKVAQQENLTPIELERLVQKANTAAALKLLKASKDKKVEFDLADYDKIMRQIYDDEPSTSKGSPELKKEASQTHTGFTSWELPYTRRESRVATTELPTLTKTAKSEDKAHTLYTHLLRANKVVEEGLTKQAALEAKFNRLTEDLVSEFYKYQGPSFSKFANETYTMYGDVAKPLLQALGKAVRAPSEELTKVAALIDDTSFVHTKFAAAQDTLKTLVEHGDKVRESRERCAALNSEVSSFYGHN